MKVLYVCMYVFIFLSITTATQIFNHPKEFQTHSESVDPNLPTKNFFFFFFFWPLMSFPTNSLASNKTSQCSFISDWKEHVWRVYVALRFEAVPWLGSKWQIYMYNCTHALIIHLHVHNYTRTHISVPAVAPGWLFSIIFILVFKKLTCNQAITVRMQTVLLITVSCPSLMKWTWGELWPESSLSS